DRGACSSCRCDRDRGRAASPAASASPRSPIESGSPSTSLDLGVLDGAALAALVGLEQTLGDELLGRQAAQPGDLVRALEALQPGDGGRGRVDVVGGAGRLAQPVVDSRLFEDRPRRAAGDDTGTGSGGLEQHTTGTGLADDLVGDRAAGPRNREEVLARL